MESLALDDTPRSLRDPVVRNRRIAMLEQLHIASLTAYTSRLREVNSGEVPYFDPLDGGVSARVLFLLEKPGPKTSVQGKREGSGFVSRNNDDATAEAIFHFMQKANLPRKSVVLWNVIPWWNGKVKVTGDELKTALPHTMELISLLSELRAIVTVGLKAGAAEKYLTDRGHEVFKSDHPSPRVKARCPERWNGNSSEWAKVHKFIER